MRALCVGEALEFDPGACVGESESLEDAKHVASCEFGGASRQQDGDELVCAERFAEFGLDQSEIRSAITMMLVSA